MSGNDRKWIVFCALACAVFVASARNSDAQDIPKCRSDSAMRVLDFWVGEWRVVDSTGTQVGTNVVERILDGCAIVENWRDAQGGEGKSLFYFVPSMRQWKQVWVTPAAMVPGGMKEKHLIAVLSNGGVRFQGEYTGPRGATVLDRTTLVPGPNGTVRQVIEVSRDGGTTWHAGFDAIYKPVAGKR